MAPARSKVSQHPKNDFTVLTCNTCRQTPTGKQMQYVTAQATTLCSDHRPMTAPCKTEGPCLQLGLFWWHIDEQILQHGLGSCCAATAVRVPGMLQAVCCKRQDQLCDKARYQLLIGIRPIARGTGIPIQAIIEQLLVPELTVKTCSHTDSHHTHFCVKQCMIQLARDSRALDNDR